MCFFTAVPPAPLRTQSLAARTLEHVIFRTDPQQVALFRVRGAVVLANGMLVVADQGNFRLVVLDRVGRELTSIGRVGGGPGEFRSVTAIFAHADTIVAYDEMQRRVSFYRADGLLLRTVTLPVHANRPMSLRALDASGRWYLSSHTDLIFAPSGLRTDRVRMFRWTPADTLVGLRELDWERSYVVSQEQGTTVYATPFLGASRLFAADSLLVLVPADGTRADVLDSGLFVRASVRLAESALGFDRRIVDRYRDSLLARVAPGSPPFERLQTVFGSTFPAPAFRPMVEDGASSGALVWLRLAGAISSPTAVWVAVDVSASRIVDRVSMPRTHRILGGTRGIVVVLERDEDGVETVVTYSIRSRPR